MSIKQLVKPIITTSVIALALVSGSALAHGGGHHDHHDHHDHHGHNHHGHDHVRIDYNVYYHPVYHHYYHHYHRHYRAVYIYSDGFGSAVYWHSSPHWVYWG